MRNSAPSGRMITIGLGSGNVELPLHFHDALHGGALRLERVAQQPHNTVVGRTERDVRERGRSARSVREQFANQVGPMHDLHVEPSKIHADIVINSQQSKHALDDQFEIVLGNIRALIQ